MFRLFVPQSYPFQAVINEIFRRGAGRIEIPSVMVLLYLSEGLIEVLCKIGLSRKETSDSLFSDIFYQ